MKYMILFIGGDIPEDKREQSITDRLAWMNELRAKGKFIDGSPLQPAGQVITGGTADNYSHDSNSVNGYAIIEASDLQEAVQLTERAPQVRPEYGSASAEIRPLQSLR